MKRKSFMIKSMMVPVTAAILLLSSCINDAELADNTGTGSDGTPKTLTLTINTGTANNAGTRTTTVGTDPGTTSENTINRVTVGIFSSDGTTVKTIQEVAQTSNAVTVTSGLLASGDQVLVAVNVPAGTFSGVTDVSGFESKTIGIDAALTSDGKAEVSSNLPMFGTGSITGTTTLTATVNVYHLVSKISLASLGVAFDAAGAYSTATFTPTEVFLLNVPDKLNIIPRSSHSYCTSGPSYEGVISGDGINITSYPYKEYLGTGTLDNTTTPASAALSGASGTSATWGGSNANKLFFYTMPNNNTTNNTRLVIKGTFVPSAGGTPATYYYPVNINLASDGTSAVDGGTAKVVAPNKHYQLNVTIKSIGVTDPIATLDQKSEAVTATVQNFDAASNQTTIFQ